MASDILELVVTGGRSIHCEKCEQRIVQEMSARPEVAEAVADYQNQRLRIALVPGADRAPVIEALAGLGYQTSNEPTFTE